MQCGDEQTPGPQEPTEVKTSFLRGDFVIFVGFSVSVFLKFCIYIIYILKRWEALHLQNDFKKALGGFLTVSDSIWGKWSF